MLSLLLPVVTQTGHREGTRSNRFCWGLLIYAMLRSEGQVEEVGNAVRSVRQVPVDQSRA